jgi:hypothetical protein
VYRLYLVTQSECKNVRCPQYVGAVQCVVRVHEVDSSSCMDDGVNRVQEACVVLLTHSQVHKRDIA